MTSIEELLQQAMEKNASDVHITMGKPSMMRINGELVRLEDQTPMAEDIKYIIQFFLNDRQKKRLEDTGEVEVALSIDQVGRCRASIFLQGGYYAAVFRLLGKEIPKLEVLQIPQTVLDLYKEKQGMVIASGSSGSGRTTTLAVLVDRINREIGGRILTLESPIEYLHSCQRALVGQREIGLDTISYASALKAALREDTDVILVGEMRDAETICAMITAAEMGHLVLGVMDAVGAVETVERMMEVFLPEQQQAMRIRLAYVLNAVISQQLIALSGIGRRQGVFDVLRANMAVKHMICEGKMEQINGVMQEENGMQRMDDGIFDLYIQGKINREQALRYVRDLSLFEKKLI